MYWPVRIYQNSRDKETKYQQLIPHELGCLLGLLLLHSSWMVTAGVQQAVGGPVWMHSGVVAGVHQFVVGQVWLHNSWTAAARV